MTFTTLFLLRDSRCCLVSHPIGTESTGMRLSYIALLSTALAWPISEKLSGCSQPLPVGQQPGSTTNVTISSNGIQRSYLIFVPPTYQPGCPASLILSYHGGNQNAGQQLELDGLTLPYFNNDSFVIYPQGIKVCRVFQE